MHTHYYQLALHLLHRPKRVLLIALGCIIFATPTQAQSSSHDFVVPGRSGINWVDTGLYLPPNTLLHFSATGKVDVSAGWGSWGPEGTSEPREFAHVAGYPVLDPTRRYGLAARLTTDVRLPVPSSPEVRATWLYPESEGYFAAPRGGHLWLTVNDDFPIDNVGSFKVHLELTTFPIGEMLCQHCPFDKITVENVIGQPLPDPKALQTLMVLDGEILSVNQLGETTLVTVSPGTVLAKYGDLPNLKVIFEKAADRSGPSFSKQSVIQGLLFQKNKMLLITAASQLTPNSKAGIRETKADTKQ